MGEPENKMRFGKLQFSGILLIACAGLLGYGEARAKISIAVNWGKFASAEQAAAGEARVDWWDADKSDDRACTEAFAAAELRKFVRACTGVSKEEIGFARAEKMPQEGDVFVVGSRHSNPLIGRDSRAERLKTEESFSVRAFRESGRTITFIEGGDRVGTLYGVYRYIEKLGVRFYGLGDKEDPRAGKTEIARCPIQGRRNGREWTYEVNEPYLVPSAGTVYPMKKAELPQRLDIVENPGFMTRGFWAWEDRGNEEFFVWMARNRMNLWTAAEREVHLLKKLGMKLIEGAHVIQPYFLDPEAEYPYDKAEFEGDEEKANDPYAGAGEYAGDINRDGTLSYFEAHPEWYGLKEGKRTDNFDPGSKGKNYCTSNAAATRELAKNLVQCLIDGRWRHVDIVLVAFLDGMGHFCECRKCREQGSPTDRLFVMAQAISGEIRQAQRDGRLQREVLLSATAYNETLVPPQRAMPAGFDCDNISVTFFPSERCYVHSLFDAKCSEFNRRISEDYRGWTQGDQRRYKGTILVGEYFNISVHKTLPIVLTKIISTDIPWYYKTGARHFYYMHAPTRLWGTWTLNQYLLGRLLWSPEAEAGVIVEEYFNRYYPTTAEHMRKAYERLEFASANFRRVKDWGWMEKFPDKDIELFAKEHIHYREHHSESDDGPDIVEMAAAMAEARSEMDEALLECGDGMERERLLEDERRVVYGEATMLFFHRMLRTAMFYRKGDEEMARHEFVYAESEAQKLRKVKDVVHAASSHANAPDGLAAMQAPWEKDVYEYFRAKYGP